MVTPSHGKMLRRMLQLILAMIFFIGAAQPAAAAQRLLGFR